MFSNRLSLLATAAMLAATTEAANGAGAGVAAEAAPAAAPTPEQIAAAAGIINGRKFKYFFKKEVIKNERGEKIGDGRKHPDVVVVLPVATPQEVIDLLGKINDKDEAGKPTPAAKAAVLIMEAADDLVFQGGRAQINDWLDKNPDGTFTPTNFDLNLLTLEYLASIPKGQRGGWAPAEDELKEFCEDYTQVMVGEVGYEAKRVKLHVEQIMKGFVKMKSDKAACQKMKDFLTLWTSKKAEEDLEGFEKLLEWLNGRLDKYLAAEEKNYAEAL